MQPNLLSDPDEIDGEDDGMTSVYDPFWWHTYEGEI